MKYLYFKENGQLWIKSAKQIAELDAEFPDPLIVEDDYETSVVDDSVTAEEDMPPAKREKTRAEIEQDIDYRTKRKAGYPPISDYIDGIVKGDKSQIDAYIEACKSVKARYPKPDVATT